MKQAQAQYTSSIIASIIARDTLEREAMADDELLHSEVVDENKEANDKAIAAGHPKGHSKWVAVFTYPNRTEKVWTESNSHVYNWRTEQRNMERSK